MIVGILGSKEGKTKETIGEKARLHPHFVEWMMGFPEGWVDVDSYSGALKCLGNAVVPHQAAYAYADLFGRFNQQV